MERRWSFRIAVVGAVWFIFFGIFSSLRGEDSLKDFEKRCIQAIRVASRSVVAIFVYPPSSAPYLLSGVVISEKGDIATFGMRLLARYRYMVLDVKRRLFRARLVAFDEVSRIGLLRVSSSSRGRWYPVRWRDSNSFSVGSLVFSVGNPYGFYFSAGYGILSGRSRTVCVEGQIFFDMLQLTLPVRPGDPGGIVVDREGRMVGMLATAYPGGGGEWGKKFQNFFAHLQRQFIPKEWRRLFQAGSENSLRFGGGGFGLALSSNFVRYVSDSLLRRGRVSWGRLGVVARQGCGGRVVVVRILPGSAAERAGLRRGDEVVGFGGISLRGLLHFQGLVLYSKVGQRVRLTIRRGGRVLGLEVVIEARRGRGGR